jgi:hypothetical protein
MIISRRRERFVLFIEHGSGCGLFFWKGAHPSDGIGIVSESLSAWWCVGTRFVLS